MIFRTGNDDYLDDIRYRRQYWTNRLILLTRTLDRDNRVWEPEEEAGVGLPHADFVAPWNEFHEIAQHLRGAGINVNDVLDGIEEGAVPYNPFANDPPVVDFDRESAPPQVLDFDEATVAFSAKQWDANVDWPGYGW